MSMQIQIRSDSYIFLNKSIFCWKFLHRGTGLFLRRWCISLSNSLHLLNNICLNVAFHQKIIFSRCLNFHQQIVSNSLNTRTFCTSLMSACVASCVHVLLLNGTLWFCFRGIFAACKMRNLKAEQWMVLLMKLLRSNSHEC